MDTKNCECLLDFAKHAKSYVLVRATIRAQRGLRENKIWKIHIMRIQPLRCGEGENGKPRITYQRGLKILPA